MCRHTYTYMHAHKCLPLKCTLLVKYMCLHRNLNRLVGGLIVSTQVTEEWKYVEMCVQQKSTGWTDYAVFTFPEHDTQTIQHHVAPTFAVWQASMYI